MKGRPKEVGRKQKTGSGWKIRWKAERAEEVRGEDAHENVGRRR